MLSVEGITLKEGRKTFLKDVSLTAAAGRITGIVGPRGAGKTELVRIVMGLITPDAGSVELEGHELEFGDRQNFGYLPEERGGYPEMKVIDQIVYFARLHGITLGAAERNAITLLGRLDLHDRAYAPLKHLSGSEVARVEIATLLAADPDVVVLDEPFAGLDMRSAESTFALLSDHADSGVPILFATDDFTAAETYADDVVVLSHGKIRAAGTPAELRSKEVSYRVELTDAQAAEKLQSNLAEHESVTDAEAAGAVVTFNAPDRATAFAAVRDRSEVTGITTVHPDLETLFKEVV